MTKTILKKISIDVLEPYFKENDYSLSNTKDCTVKFIKKESNCSDGFLLSTLDYGNGQTIKYFYYKRIDSIEKIYKTIGEEIRMSPGPGKDSFSFSFSYESLNGLLSHGYLPMCYSEGDVIDCCNKIIDYASNTAMDVLKTFSDIKKIDSQINGDDFWETDWKKPFNLGGQFDVKRLIICRLAGQYDFENIVDKTYKYIERESSKNGQEFIYNREDLTKKIPYTVKILKEFF